MTFGGWYRRYEAAIGKVINKFVLAGIGISLFATVMLIELCKMIR